MKKGSYQQVPFNRWWWFQKLYRKRPSTRVYEKIRAHPIRKYKKQPWLEAPRRGSLVKVGWDICLEMGGRGMRWATVQRVDQEGDKKWTVKKKKRIRIKRKERNSYVVMGWEEYPVNMGSRSKSPHGTLIVQDGCSSMFVWNNLGVNRRDSKK